MPQHAKYELEQVLEKALDLAVVHGYKACSMSTLIDGTGFNRRAFYMHFKNKEDFFEALLNHYLQAHLLPLNRYLQASNNAQACIEDYFAQYQKLIQAKGCLLTKLVVEMGARNQAIAHQARWFYDQLQLEFIALLERAQLNSQIEIGINIEQRALRLCCLSQGFAVSNHLDQGEDDIALMIKSIFTLS